MNSLAYAESPPALFTYGSLMCTDIMAQVSGQHLVAIPAVLPHYRRFLVKDEQYPGVVADLSGSVPGQVYRGISAPAWARLDRFEGEMYARKPVRVCYDGGGDAVVFCYVFRPEFAHRLTDREWSFETFLASGKAAFELQYDGFKVIE